MASDDTALWAAWRQLGSYEWLRLSQQEGARAARREESDMASDDEELTPEEMASLERLRSRANDERAEYVAEGTFTDIAEMLPEWQTFNSRYDHERNRLYVHAEEAKNRVGPRAHKRIIREGEPPLHEWYTTNLKDIQYRGKKSQDVSEPPTLPPLYMLGDVDTPEEANRVREERKRDKTTKKRLRFARGQRYDGKESPLPQLPESPM